jgi:hypothetical protein
MNSDRDKLSVKVIDLDEIYNFIVKTLFIWNHSQLCSLIIIHLKSSSCSNNQSKFQKNIWTIKSQISLRFATLYKIYLHLNSYKIVMIFKNCDVDYYYFKCQFLFHNPPPPHTHNEVSITSYRHSIWRLSAIFAKILKIVIVYRDVLCIVRNFQSI